MLSSVRHWLAPVLVGAAVGAGAIACGPSHSTSVSPAASAAAKSDAKALEAKCIPASATAQVKLATSLKTESGRAKFEASCGIPPAHKAQFEAQVIAAAEAGHLTTKAGRATFFEVTLPKIAEANQG